MNPRFVCGFDSTWFDSWVVILERDHLRYTGVVHLSGKRLKSIFLDLHRDWGSYRYRRSRLNREESIAVGWLGRSAAGSYRRGRAHNLFVTRIVNMTVNLGC